MSDDTELLRRYATDHAEAAFATLVQRHVNLVYFAALRRTDGDPHLAEEVTQLVFTALARNAASLQRHTVLPGWLYVTTRHAAANAMRTEQRRRNREQEAYTMQELSPTPEADWHRLRPELDSVMDELNEPDRDAVLLRFFEDRPFADIGRVLQVSEDAARMRVDRALDKLRTLLRQRGITSTSSVLAGMLASQSALAAPASLAATVTGVALTSATITAGTATAVKALGVMSTTKIMTGIAGAVAIMAVGTAVHEYRESHQVQADWAAVSRERDSFRTEMQRLESQAREAEEKTRLAQARAAALEKSLIEALAGKSGPAATPSNATRSASTTPGAQTLTTMDMLFANAEYQQLAMKQFESSLRLKYGPLYRKLGLSPPQIAEFESLLVEQNQAMVDTFAAARSQGVSLTDPALARLKLPENNATGDKFRQLLGETGFSEYLAYAKKSSARATTDSLAGNLYYTETPLTLDQGEQLMQIIAANTPKIKMTGLMGVAPEPDWETIIAQAGGVLQPPQLATLQALREKTRLDRQYNELYQKILSEAVLPVSPPKG